jgi:AcrR family transcriptional regulator
MVEDNDPINVILTSARTEILHRGILGLRVADVAANANTSITQIYRFFRNRDGLLARVLGDIFEEITQASIHQFKRSLLDKESLTIDDLVNALPLDITPEIEKLQEFRLQILATSIHNVQLRQNLETTMQNLKVFWTEGLDEIQQRMAPGEAFDTRFFFMVLGQQLPYYRVLAKDALFSTEEFRDFVREKIRR